MSKALPPGQTRILAFFADAEDEGRQPSRAEVAEAMGYAFPSAVSKHVDALVRKGMLAADRDKKRNVRLTESGWAAIERAPSRRGVPVIGAIAAGVPILAAEQHAGYLDDVQPAPGRVALKVRGDSMVDAGILDGDYAVIQADGKISEGHIGAVVVDGEATLKRIRYGTGRIELHPENRRYQPLVVVNGDGRAVQVVGPLSFIYRRVR
ncbi:MAG: repressor LexA [Planctomycetes bacterium]|nr:repressor LexA [Planctomycetota bacterium]